MTKAEGVFLDNISKAAEYFTAAKNVVILTGSAINPQSLPIFEEESLIINSY
jgi:hypothetical protein